MHEGSSHSRSAAIAQAPLVTTPRTEHRLAVPRRLQPDWLMDVEVSLHEVSDEAPHGLPLQLALLLRDQFYRMTSARDVTPAASASSPTEAATSPR